MSQLTPRQYETLYKLVQGTSKKQDGRSMRALERFGLVNEYGVATTAGWHAVGELRYVPDVRIPLDWEVDSWKGQYLEVTEGPSYTISERKEGKIRWTRARSKKFNLDIHQMMKYYQDCRRAESQWVAAKWETRDDFDFEQEIKYGWRSYSADNYDKIRILARNESHNEVEEKWEIFYISDIIYGIANDLFLLRYLRMKQNMDTTFKYSFQDNPDEVENFLLKQQPKNTPYAVVTISVD